MAEEVLVELGVLPERVLLVWNKTDVRGAARPREGVCVSALLGTGLADLEAAILLRARPEPDRFRLRIPYADGEAIASARAAFRVLREEDLGEALSLQVAGEKGKSGA